MKPTPSPSQVMKKVTPIPGESSRGYLRRVAAYWLYTDPLLLLSLAEVRESDVDRDGSSEKIAFALRLAIDEWKSVANRRTVDEGISRLIWFAGERIGYGQLTFAHPRICIKCFREQKVERRTWELTLMTMCARHGCYLIDACPKCGKYIPRRRANPHLCSCGFDLCDSEVECADADSVAISALIENAINSKHDEKALAASDCGFPQALHRLSFDELLRLICFLGRIYEEGEILRAPHRMRRAASVESRAIVRKAGKFLAKWPDNFICLLQNALRIEEREQHSSVVVAYNTFYHRLYHEFGSTPFHFIRKVFEEFMLENWQGTVGGNPKWLPADSRDKLGWHSAEEAGDIVGIRSVKRLMESGELEGFFVRRGEKGIYRISKESVREFERKRDTLIPRLELARLLGLSHQPIVGLAKEGLIRYAPCEQSARHFFIREDGLRLLDAFTRYEVPVLSVWDKTQDLTLHEAKRTVLNSYERLACVIQAVIDDKLVPIARTELHPGIGGYIFSILDLQTHCRRLNSEGKPVIYLNATQSAKYIGICEHSLAGLVLTGHLRSAGVRQCKRLRQLQIPLTELESFANRYAGTASVARRLGLSTKSLVNRLRERNVPFLAVTTRDGRRTLFVPREIADGLKVPLQRLDPSARKKGDPDLAA